MRRCYSIIIVSTALLLQSFTVTAEEVEAGPEDGGLRLRWRVSPRADAKEGYEVRLELLNVSDRPITLKAAWRNDNETGGVEEYLEAATGIESVPTIAPWIGAVQEAHRMAPQPEQVLKDGARLSVVWKTDGPRLKNRVTNPNEVQNPSFPFPGLYSVHAIVDVATSEGMVRLRSNEQLVSVAGSRSAPKSTFGRLIYVDSDGKTAVLGLGSLHKIGEGDEFEIGHPKGGHWKLTITRTEPGMSHGSIEPLSTFRPPDGSLVPRALMDANLMKRQ